MFLMLIQIVVVVTWERYYDYYYLQWYIIYILFFRFTRQLYCFYIIPKNFLALQPCEKIMSIILNILQTFVSIEKQKALIPIG